MNRSGEHRIMAEVRRRKGEDEPLEDTAISGSDAANKRNSAADSSDHVSSNDLYVEQPSGSCSGHQFA